MKIVSWNINGIRASNNAQTLKDILDSLEADIICLQETKVTRDQLTEAVANVEGYYAFFSFSRKRSGYSGVATYCKKSCCPLAAEEGLSDAFSRKLDQTNVGHYGAPLEMSVEELKTLDSEGRALVTEHVNQNGLRICLINTYCPRADLEDKERFKFKMDFHFLLQARCESLLKAGKHVIVAGDLNICHKPIDHCDPEPDFASLPHRQWLTSLLHSGSSTVKNALNPLQVNTCDISNYTETLDLCRTSGNGGENLSEGSFVDAPARGHTQSMGKFVDSFRYFHPCRTEAYSCWNTKVRARETNYGTRIDYILSDVCLHRSECTSADIHPEVLGSDHCPVSACFSTDFRASEKVPSLCALFMPEFSGKQMGIKSFFARSGSASDLPVLSTDQPSGNQLGDQNGKRKADVTCETLTGKRRATQGKIPSKLTSYFRSHVIHDSVSESRLRLSKETAPFESTAESRNGSFDSGVGDALGSYFASEPSLPVRSPKQAQAWKAILSGPAPPPLCTGHCEPSLLRTVKKPGPNLGRQFYVCCRPDGHASNKNARCNFFKWKDSKR